MENVFENNGIILTEEKRAKLNEFSAFLREYNEKVNLTAIVEPAEVEKKHFLDSLMGMDYFPQNAKVVEIGSGGGFPSVPLKIAREDLSFTQVESVGKKCKFLEETAQKFAFSNHTVINARAEDLGKNKAYRETFDCVTARAVANLSTLSEYCLPLVKVGGVFVCYKGNCQQAEEEATQAKNALFILGGKIEKTVKYTLPGGDERTIFLIKKVKPTPEKYPRGNGKERSKPL
ncbi:MAG: 16S rRNA (guanine(527)-N(7))-methyltransferase RsmG [Clostridia bacterium]|nr:16S rRNA (guanine(527)-N(7))-methyltransferase RsmG [Clostridia bacterium]